MRCKYFNILDYKIALVEAEALQRLRSVRGLPRLVGFNQLPLSLVTTREDASFTSLTDAIEE